MDPPSRNVESVREFNRFYTRQIGLLQEGLLASPFSLTEVRIMFELSQRANCTASDLANELGLNHGYLSRILRRFQSLGFITKKRSPADGRQLLLTLTSKGHRAYAPLDKRASSEIEALLEGLSASEIRRLLDAMKTIRRLLSPKMPGGPGFVCRDDQTKLSRHDAMTDLAIGGSHQRIHSSRR
jgi:DNA-binding MarR family transcriptional regulator